MSKILFGNIIVYVGMAGNVQSTKHITLHKIGFGGYLDYGFRAIEYISTDRKLGKDKIYQEEYDA